MDRKKLLRLIKKNEGLKLDFKLRIDLNCDGGKKELAKDVCAIANSKGGRGYIIIGVEDKTKRIVGIDNRKIITEEKVQQIISSRCEPPIPIKLEEVNINDKLLLIITIYDGNQKPYQIKENGAFYIRRGSTTDVMRKQEIIAAFQDGLSLNLEVCPILKSDIQALNMNIVKKYFKAKGIEINDENKEFLLDSSNILFIDNITGERKCTLGGLLVFSSINSIYIPHNLVRVINKVNKNIDNVTIINGTILEIIDKTEIILKKILPKEYPIYAINEAVKNAVLYRDYSEMNKVVEVVITNNSIIITSPGGLIKKSKREDVNYARRNMWIYEKVITLDDKKKFLKTGNGFFRMKKAFKDIGNIKIINSKEEDCVKVIFPGVNLLKNI